MREPRIREQLKALDQVLTDTSKKELVWAETGTDGYYVSRNGSDQALIGRDDGGLVFLQFMTDGRPDFTVRLRQLGPDADRTPDELDRDGRLSLLLDEVVRRVHPGGEENAMSRFTRR